MDNIYYNNNQDEFWDFSWDEFALHDLPGQINYILGVTGAQKISYIGHSEGTTQAFAGFLNETLASKVSIFIALAPATYASNIGSVLVQALAALNTDEIFALLGIHEFYLPNVIDKLLPGICNIDPNLCEFDLNLIGGPTTFLNTSRISYYLHFEPNPTSVKNMAHWAQQVRTGTFAMFDYGTQGNIQHYNQPTPPQYELTNFPTSLPVAIFNGGDDYLADPDDVAILISMLPVPPMIHTEPLYAHFDPLLGYNAYQRIYPMILNLINKYNGK
jgi:pimeloyl-ACP methyl ester carboxylesterase